MHGNNKTKEAASSSSAQQQPQQAASKSSNNSFASSPPSSPPNSPLGRPLDMDDFDFATLSIHADRKLENAPDIAPPMHLSTTYKLGNPDNLVYSRAGKQSFQDFF